MKVPILALATLITISAARAQNMASAEWIPESATVVAGKEFRTVIRLKVDEGWHTYWENPGEGGLPISVKIDLPEGWILGEIQFPAPIAFMTGPLHGFGYEGEILFPLTLTAPSGSEVAKIPEAIVARISWLTCNDKRCVPGKEEASLASADPMLVKKAYEQLPEAIPGSKLSYGASDDAILLTLSLPTGAELDPATHRVFPVNRDFLDPSSEPVFKKDAGTPSTWTASAPKSEYFDEEPETLSLVLVGDDGKAWKISTSPQSD